MLDDSTGEGLTGGWREFADQGGSGHIEGEVVDLDDAVPKKRYLGHVVCGVDVAEIKLQYLIQTSKLVVHFHRLVHLPPPHTDLPKFRQVIRIHSYELEPICCDEHLVYG